MNHERCYDVTITETLKRTVTVRAKSAEEAQSWVEQQWKDSVHVLDSEDFKDVHFTTTRQIPKRDLVR